MALPIFHVFTEGDTISYLGGGGGGGRENTAWKVWMAFNDATKAFCYLARYMIFYCPFVHIIIQQINLLPTMGRLIFLKDSLYYYRTEQVMNIQ